MLIHIYEMRVTESADLDVTHIHKNTFESHKTGDITHKRCNTTKTNMLLQINFYGYVPHPNQGTMLPSGLIT